MKKILLTVCAILLCTSSFAQRGAEDHLEEQKAWWLEGTVNASVNFDFKLNADKFEDLTNLSLNTDLTLHHTKDSWRWDTHLVSRLNFKHDPEIKAYPMRKKNDHLQLTTSLAYHISNRLFVSGDLRFDTIMAPKWFYHGSGEDVQREKVSGFLSPGSIDLSPSIQWRPTAKKESYLTVGAAPIGGRVLICLLQDSLTRMACLGDYFAQKGGNVHLLFGGYVDCKYTWERKNFSGRVQVGFFLPYRNGTFDIRLSYKFAKAFSINLTLYSRYVNSAYRSIVITDKRIKENAEFRDRIDLSEQLTLGVGWTF